MAVSVPTLTSEGYVRDPARKVDRLLTQAFTSDYSQSNNFRGFITSVQYLIQDAGQDMNKLEESLDQALRRLFGGYFDSIDVDIQVKPISAENPYRMGVEVRSILIQDGMRYNIARLLYLSPSGVLAQLLPISYT